MGYSKEYYFDWQIGILIGVYFGVALFLIICCYNSKNILENVLFAINRIVTRKNVDKRPRYFICGRICPEYIDTDTDIDIEKRVAWVAVTVIAACTSLFSLLFALEISNECRNDPYLDCFKKRSNPEPSDSPIYESSPVNCSAISNADVVLCFRLGWPDFERVAVAGAASYLGYQIMTISLIITAHIILAAKDCCASRCKECCCESCKSCCKIYCECSNCISKMFKSLLMLISIFGLPIGIWAGLRYKWKAYGYQVENLPDIRICQIVLAFFPFFFLNLCVPWNKLNPKYLEEVSEIELNNTNVSNH